MKICETCKSAFSKPHRLSDKVWLARRFCSRACYGISTIRHGESHAARKTKEYAIWQAMIQRCSNPNSNSWRKYGARGITVCERWQSYEAFLSDMGRKPDNMSLDRIDNNKGYEPSNCRWATSVEQANNTRSNKCLTHNGETKTISEWSRKIGIRENTLVCRLKRGWSVERTLSEPIWENYAHMRKHP